MLRTSRRSIVVREPSETGHDGRTYVDIVNIFHRGIPTAVLREGIIPTLPSNRPVHQIKIDIIQAQIVEGFLQRRLNVFRVMFVVPEFGGDEEVFARDTGPLDRVSDGLFGAISSSCQHLSVKDLWTVTTK